MPKYKCKVKVKIWEESEIEETIEVDAPDEPTAEDDALTIVDQMQSNPDLLISFRISAMESFPSTNRASNPEGNFDIQVFR